MSIRLAGFAEDSIVDGTGIRLTVFTQGCFHNCPNCQNPQTHDSKGGELYEVEYIIQKFHSNPLYSGITLSGGEPFLQAESCIEIAKAIHSIPRKTVWCYTGYTFEELLKAHRADFILLLSNIDVLVDGRFVESLKSPDIRFRGSTNQRLIDMNATKNNCWSPVTFE